MSETLTEYPPAPDMREVVRLVHMDRSRHFSTVHGDRRPGDPDQHVSFIQDGLPYDSKGCLIAEHPDYDGDTPEARKRRQTRDKKIERALKDYQKRKPAIREVGPRDDADVDDETEDDEEEAEAAEINLDAWLRGLSQYEWNDISNAICARYSKRVSGQPDAVAFLAEELKVPPEQVAKKFRRYL